MKKLAIIVAESFGTLRGQAIAELNRIQYLKKIADYQVDVYSFSIYERWLVRNLRHTKKNNISNERTISGVKIKFFWRAFSLIDYILSVKLHKSPIINKGWTLKYVNLFKEYDLIMAHSSECGELALAIHNKYGIPYCITWHGSDIHTCPFSSEYAFQNAKRILDNAEVNFMVSKKLLQISEQISTINNKVVLYNGIGSIYKRYDEGKRKSLREKYNVSNKKVVAFAGNLVSVKNPMSLPEIFKQVFNKYKNVEFWIMGTGKYYNMIKQKCEEYNLPFVMWGDVPSEEMPDRYNSIDVLVLPSINEGLPLVVIEALACGANVVGSTAGGIPEAIGAENAFKRDKHFAENLGNRIVNMLTEGVDQKLNPVFSWAKTAKLENEIYHKIFNKHIKNKF